MEFNKIEFFILWFFYNLQWFFKDSTIFLKEKDKTIVTVASRDYCSEQLQNPSRVKMLRFEKVERGEMPDFIVAERKLNFRDNWRM